MPGCSHWRSVCFPMQATWWVPAGTLPALTFPSPGAHAPLAPSQSCPPQKGHKQMDASSPLGSDPCLTPQEQGTQWGLMLTYHLEQQMPLQVRLPSPLPLSSSIHSTLACLCMLTPCTANTSARSHQVRCMPQHTHTKHRTHLSALKAPRTPPRPRTHLVTRTYLHVLTPRHAHTEPSVLTAIPKSRQSSDHPCIHAQPHPQQVL